jgi:hypothetical protein
MAFDAEALMNVTTTEQGSTEVVQCPPNDYLAILDDIKFRHGNKKDDPSDTWFAMDVIWDIQDDAVRAELGRPKVTVKQQLFLDMTDDGKGFDMGKGKNVGLNRLREALDMNKPGEPFSPAQMKGRAAMVKVTHRPDQNKPGVVYAEVTAVSRQA